MSDNEDQRRPDLDGAAGSTGTSDESSPTEELPPVVENQPDEEQISPLETLLTEWSKFFPEQKIARFRTLTNDEAEDLIHALPGREQALLFEEMSRAERRLWVRFLAPDDACDLIQELPEEIRTEILNLTDETTRREITALLSYREDEAGGLMSPRFPRVRPDMLVGEAIRYVRQQARVVEAIHYVYVLDSAQHLLGIVSLRHLFVSPADKKISEIMDADIVTIPAEMDQEAISRIFTQHRWSAMPVVDNEGRMQGVVTVDDILDVSQEEATEDIQKLGGMESLDAPYPDVKLLDMIKKRAGWLTILFVGEMFTATAMSAFENELATAVVLGLFIPLIISSGGNSGSQATSLIIRSMALGELKLSDWWKVFWREFATGLSLGVLLAAIAMCRILLWPNHEVLYTQHFVLVSITVACSLIGVVLFGTIAGSMLPFILRKCRLDPASASAPMVATMVDVTGLVIYFSVAKLILRGVLL
jgi:magnesium transporter